MPLNTLNVQLPPETKNIEEQTFDPPLLILYEYLVKYYKSMRVDLPKISASTETELIYAASITYERMGCPALALAISSRYFESAQKALNEADAALRAKTSVDTARLDRNKDSHPAALNKESQNPTDKADAFDWSLPVPSEQAADKSDAFDWSAPVSSQQTVNKADAFDWSAPVSSQQISNKADAFDWSKPVSAQKSTAVEKPDLIDWNESVSSQQTKPTANSIDWSSPVASQNHQQSDGLFDWDASATSANNAISLDDEYERFKRSLMGDDQQASNDGTDEKEIEADQTISEIVQAPFDTSSQNVQDIDPGLRTGFELDVLCIRRLRYLQLFKILHTLDQSVACVSKHQDILSQDSTMANYFSHVARGLEALGNIIDLKLEVVENLIYSRCKEFDTFLSFLEIPILVPDTPRTLPHFCGLLVEGCNHLARIALDRDEDSENDDKLYMMDMARCVFSILFKI